MSFEQSPRALLMVRPQAFFRNPETAGTNAFQTDGVGAFEDVHTLALQQFNTMVDILRAHHVEVIVVDDTRQPVKPDALFPNNWVTFHEGGQVILYPMMAPNRRPERRMEIVELLKENFLITRVIDFSSEETRGNFLEGTGSIVFDHPNRVAYACRSPRTHESLLVKVCDELGYTFLLFDAVDETGNHIYHTNVVMSIGKKFAVLCLDAIASEQDQENLLQSLSETHHQVIALSYEQMRAFAGNLLEIESKEGEAIVILSQTALKSFLPGQISAIAKYGTILPLEVDCIEKYGGGSVRCMVAGIHLPKRLK